MTHRLEAAAAATRSGGDQDLYDDPETGGTLGRRKQDDRSRNESRGQGELESIPMRDLGNSTEADDNAYEVPDEIPGFRKAIQVSHKRQIMQELYISSKVKMQKN